MGPTRILTRFITRRRPRVCSSSASPGIRDGGRPSAPSGLAKLPVSSRAVLWVGFGGLIGLMVLIAVSASHALAKIEWTNAEIRRGYLQRDDLLNRLRATLYRSGIDLRDYLLHPD